MEKRILALSKKGHTDAEVAKQLPATGHLTVSQLARTLGTLDLRSYTQRHDPNHRDAKTGLHLFPVHSATLEQFKQLEAGKLYNLRYSEGYQYA